MHIFINHIHQEAKMTNYFGIYVAFGIGTTLDSDGASSEAFAVFYERTRTEINAGRNISAADLATLNMLRNPPAEGEPSGGPVQTQAQMIWTAVNRVSMIRTEAARVPLLTSGNGSTGSALVTNDQIGQENLDYQMAVLTVKEFTDAAGLGAGLARAYGDKVNSGNFSNQFDVVGDTVPSAVANSQWHIGQDMRVFIEDQPLYRGGVTLNVVLCPGQRRAARLRNWRMTA